MSVNFLVCLSGFQDVDSIADTFILLIRGTRAREGWGEEKVEWALSD